MVTLSLAMIVKNEEETLERVLTCAQPFCDELVVLDTGSTDNTVNIAQKLGAKVYHFQWVDDFAAARNEAFSKATGDWIIWLDADDIITSEDQARIQQLKTTLNDEIDGVFLTYQYDFDSTGKCSYSLLRERLIRRGAGLKWENAVHECIALPHDRFRTHAEINIQHKPLGHKQVQKVGRNLRILENLWLQGDRSPRTLFYYANELRDNKRFEDAIPIYQQYLEVSNLAWEKFAALISLGECQAIVGDPESAKTSYFQAVLLDSARSEGFIKLGILFYEAQQWTQAIPFFQAALAARKPTDGFVNPADYSYVPHDYLSICYDRLKEYETATHHALQALKTCPERDRVIKNLHWLIDQL